MSTGEITKVALERRLVRCQGKTPENTMASALYTDVRKRGSSSPFIKPKEGLFGLKAWLSEPWLLEWLSHEGIAITDFLPDFTSDTPSPPRKRNRLPTSGPRSWREHRPGNYRQIQELVQEDGEGGAYEGYEYEIKEEPDTRWEQEYDNNGIDEDDGGRAYEHGQEVETDSDQKSNLALLLEAADEIDRCAVVGRPTGKSARSTARKQKGSEGSRGRSPEVEAYYATQPTTPQDRAPGREATPPPPHLSSSTHYPHASSSYQQGEDEAEREVTPPPSGPQGDTPVAPIRQSTPNMETPMNVEGGFGPMHLTPSGCINDQDHPGSFPGDLPTEPEAQPGPLSNNSLPLSQPSPPLPPANPMIKVEEMQGERGPVYRGLTPQPHDTEANGTPGRDLTALVSHGVGNPEGYGIPLGKEDVDSTKINQYRQHILLLEKLVGNMHPQVGKAYVFLARLLQHEGSKWSVTMAQRALLRAWQILAAMQTKVDPTTPSSLENFSYLMGHLQEAQNEVAMQEGDQEEIKPFQEC